MGNHALRCALDRFNLNLDSCPCHGGTPSGGNFATRSYASSFRVPRIGDLASSTRARDPAKGSLVTPKRPT